MSGKGNRFTESSPRGFRQISGHVRPCFAPVFSLRKRGLRRRKHHVTGGDLFKQRRPVPSGDVRPGATFHYCGDQMPPPRHQSNAMPRRQGRQAITNDTKDTHLMRSPCTLTQAYFKTPFLNLRLVHQGAVNFTALEKLKYYLVFLKKNWVYSTKNWSRTFPVTACVFLYIIYGHKPV